MELQTPRFLKHGEVVINKLEEKTNSSSYVTKNEPGKEIKFHDIKQKLFEITNFSFGTMVEILAYETNAGLGKFLRQLVLHQREFTFPYLSNSEFPLISLHVAAVLFSLTGSNNETKDILLIMLEELSNDLLATASKFDMAPDELTDILAMFEIVAFDVLSEARARGFYQAVFKAAGNTQFEFYFCYK